MHIVQVENGKIVMEYDGREIELVFQRDVYGARVYIMEGGWKLRSDEAEFFWMKFCKELLEMENALIESRDM